MSTTIYEDVLRSAQQLSPEEQAQLIEDLQGAANVAADDAAKAAGEDKLPLREAIEREEWASTGAPLNEPQPYSSPRTSSDQ